MNDYYKGNKDSEKLHVEYPGSGGYTEEKVRYEEFEKAMLLARIGSWELDISKQTISWSPITRMIHEVEAGFQPDVDNPWSFFKQGDSRECMDRHIRLLIERGKTFDLEFEITTFTGQDKWVRVIGEAEFAEGRCRRIYGSMQDIDARKKAEILAKKHLEERNTILIESEKRYSDLFHLSPQPMWVYERDTLRILDVNRAAVIHYGYDYEEFLQMTIRDIRPQEDLSKLEEVVLESNRLGRGYFQGIFRHKKKNGEIVHVDIQSNVIVFNKKPAKIVLATDITEKLRYIEEIEKQNEKLREISWTQSHVMRAPVARLMGLIGLFTEYGNSPDEQRTILNYILDTAHQLDEIIKDISAKTEDYNLLP